MGIKKNKALAKTVAKNLRDLYPRQPGNWSEGFGVRNSNGQMKPAAIQVARQIPMAPELWDTEFIEMANASVKSRVVEFHEALKQGKVQVEEAWLFEGRCDLRGRLMSNKRLIESAGNPYRIRHVIGSEYSRSLTMAQQEFAELPSRVERVTEAKKKFIASIESLRAKGFFEDTTDLGFNTDAILTPFDANQYTEYTPLYGGPFNKQLYLYDYLTMHARAFEAKNHNPLAKRIIDLLAQYAFGRRFKVRIKNNQQLKAWQDFNKENKIIHKLSKFWIREYATYGELMVDKSTWNSVDPSSVWDIITNPDDISEVYYYYQSYATAYQTFTGISVPGAPGSKNQPPLKYIIRQIPAKQMLHIKTNVVSQEKRGRSVLFPILGWLKRVKDLYNAQVIRAQLESSFVWDDTIDGSQADVNLHASTYSSMPTPASVFVHNKSVERKAMAAMPSGSQGSKGPGDEILAFIATAIGVPKDFFNLISTGGGNRATALVGSEPFEKVIEDLQADFENLLLSIVEDVFENAGLPYKDGDVEFVFPSVTKDTTTEVISNVSKGEVLGYISHQTAAEMFAAEMNITTYDYEDEQSNIKTDRENGIDPMMPPGGRFSNPNDGSVSQDQSPVNGQGRMNLKRQINTL